MKHNLLPLLLRRLFQLFLLLLVILAGVVAWEYSQVNIRENNLKGIYNEDCINVIAFIATYDHNGAFDDEETQLHAIYDRLSEQEGLPVNLVIHRIDDEYLIPYFREEFYAQYGPIDYTHFSGHGEPRGIVFGKFSFPEFDPDATLEDTLDFWEHSFNDHMLTLDDVLSWGYDFAQQSSSNHRTILHSCSVFNNPFLKYESLFLKSQANMLSLLPYYLESDMEGPNEIYWGSSYELDEEGQVSLKPVMATYSDDDQIKGMDASPLRYYYTSEWDDDGNEFIATVLKEGQDFTLRSVFNRTANTLYEGEILNGLVKTYLSGGDAFFTDEDLATIEYVLSFDSSKLHQEYLYTIIPQSYESIAFYGKPTTLEMLFFRLDNIFEKFIK